MKKFLIFLVAIITTVCIGVTFYQFAKNDEIIKINTETLYINYGEKVSLDDLGFSRIEPSKETKINFNAGGDEVTSIIKFDSDTQCYIPTAMGGSTTIKITTSNRKYKSFNINVLVGTGTMENPFYISNEKQLFTITNDHIDKNMYFKVVNDITLTETHTPIGYINGSNNNFVGTFDGGFHKISNLTIDSCDYSGLFAIIGAESSVSNLKIVDAKFEGDYTNVGVVAGKCYGSINRIEVVDATITNSKADGNTGGIVGILETDTSSGIVAELLRSTAYTENDKTITANGCLGGLAGVVNSARLRACYTNLSLKHLSGTTAGGLVGLLSVDPNTYIHESYSVSKLESSAGGNIAGTINLAQGIQKDAIENQVLVGLYYDKTVNPSFGAAHSDSNDFAKDVKGKTTEEMKDPDTYVYYYTKSGNAVFWSPAWDRVDGDYPRLIFSDKFNDVTLDDNIINDKLPSVEEENNTSVTEIKTKEDLIKNFQNYPGNSVNGGTYVLTADIDLGGMEWKPVIFNGGIFKSTEGRKYTISNFKIVSNEKTKGYYYGFFYSLTSAVVENIKFSSVTIDTIATEDAQTSAGIVAGFIGGDVAIRNVDVSDNSIISAKATYAGLIAGYIKYITEIRYCDVENSSITNSLNVGAIAGYACNDAYIIYCNTTQVALLGIDRVGGIAAVNYGYVNNCDFRGRIQSSTSSSAGLFGGICAINFGTIEFSTTYAEITVTNTCTTPYYVAGICAYNKGIITKSNAYASQYSAKDSTSKVYIAGLVGYNSGDLSYNLAEVTTIGSVKQNISSAGIAITNFGGKIFGCFAFGDLYGYLVAGLALENTAGGTIDSCMTAKSSEFIWYTEDTENQKVSDLYRSTYKGVIVSGLVYNITSGDILDCIVNAEMTCINGGQVAGFAGFMPYSNNVYGTITHCIANVKLIAENGKCYLETAEEGLLAKRRSTGTISQCVISNEYDAAKTVIAKPSKNFFGKEQAAGSGSNYVIKTIDEMKDIKTYRDEATCNFSIAVALFETDWLYVNQYHLPIPRPFLIVFGHDIIGLS